MKKVFLLISMISFLQICKAQEEVNPRKNIVGGAINYFTQNNSYPFATTRFPFVNGGLFSNSTEESKYNQFAVSCYDGRQLNEKWILGGQLGYHYSITNTNIRDFQFIQVVNNFKHISNNFKFGIFARYNLNPQNRFNFYLSPYTNYTTFKQKSLFNSVSNEITKGSYVDIGLDFGMLYNINDKFRVTARLGGLNYINGNWKIVGTETKRDFSSFGSSFDFSSILLGFEMMY